MLESVEHKKQFLDKVAELANELKRKPFSIHAIDKNAFWRINFAKKDLKQGDIDSMYTKAKELVLHYHKKLSELMNDFGDDKDLLATKPKETTPELLEFTTIIQGWRIAQHYQRNKDTDAQYIVWKALKHPGKGQQVWKYLGTEKPTLEKLIEKLALEV